MPHPTAAFFLIASATALGSSAQQGVLDGLQLAQVTVRERIIIRVPRNAAPPPKIRWVEKKGPKCIAADQLGGAIVGTRSVDLVLRGGNRVRAILDGDCPALDFYSGFYLKSSGDGQICARRDTIRSRSGDSCEISVFKQLVPRK